MNRNECLSKTLASTSLTPACLTYHRVHQREQTQKSCDCRVCRRLSHRIGSCNTQSIISFKSNQWIAKTSTYIEAGRVKLRPKKPLSIPVSVTYACLPSGEKVKPVTLLVALSFLGAYTFLISYHWDGQTHPRQLSQHLSQD